MIVIPAAVSGASYYTFEEARELYDQGVYSEAETIFSRLADEGDARAQYYLGRMELTGRGGEPDPEAACDWFERAADNNHLAAFYEFGNCYFTGEGRKQDLDQALYLYGVAAERGQTQAQYKLARLFASGSGGVRKNSERAYIYLFLALRGDLGQAPLLRDSLEAELSEEQLQRAQEFALKLLARQSRSEEG